MDNEKLEKANKLSELITLNEKYAKSLNLANNESYIERPLQIKFNDDSITIEKKHFKPIMALIQKLQLTDLEEYKQEFNKL